MADNDSDIDDGDLENYKGIYFDDKTEKYQDPVTGCHFKYFDLCQRLIKLKATRKIIDKRLGLISSSKVLSPKAAKDAKDSKKGQDSSGQNRKK